MRFLVIQQKMIGDVLTSTIICENLKKFFPNCTIDYVANYNTLAVLHENPHIDNIIIFNKEHEKNKLKFFKFLTQLRKNKYDAVIDSYSKLESKLMCLFSKSALKISYKKKFSSIFYDKTIIRKTDEDPLMPRSIKHRLLLLSPLNISLKDCVIEPKIYLNNDEVNKAKSLLKSKEVNTNKPILMMSIVGSNHSKTYPYEYMAKTIDLITSQIDATILFNYIPSQKDDVLKIYDLCNQESKERIRIDIFADSLRNFLALLSQCNTIIGNEGGAINMGKALNVDSFCIFSPKIKKGAWFVSNEKNHVGVHLNDFKPHLFEQKSKKEIKKNNLKLYQEFVPELFFEELKNFIKKIRR